MKTIRRISSISFLLAVAWAASAPGQNETTLDDPTITDAQVQQWVANLDSDRFFQRRNATEELIQLGERAIEPVSTAVHGSSLETISRCIYILSELATSTKFETESKAYTALETIAEKKVTLAARRAASALDGLGELRQRRAKEYLSKKGAIITEDYVRVTELQPRSFPCVIFGEQWRGTVTDLRHLKWITAEQDEPIGPRMLSQSSKWLVTLDGPDIGNEYLSALTEVPGISAVKIRKTKISGEGLAHLQDIKELVFLDVLYNPLTPAAVPHLSKLKTLSRFRLFGSKLATDQVDELRKAIDQCDIDFREGGFLGISCKPGSPCRVEDIVPNSAADLAGLQQSDVITTYKSQPVQDFTELVKLIGDNAPGDTVDVEILRRGDKVNVKVRLGEWD